MKQISRLLLPTIKYKLAPDETAPIVRFSSKERAGTWEFTARKFESDPLVLSNITELMINLRVLSMCDHFTNPLTYNECLKLSTQKSSQT